MKLSGRMSGVVEGVATGGAYKSKGGQKDLDGLVSQ